MRFILFSDLQAKEGTARCFTDPATPLQRWRVRKFYAWLYAKAEELQVDGVIDAGDTTDRRDAISLPTIDTILAANARFGDTFQCNIKVQGNHDHHVRDGSIHNGEMFNRDYTVVADKVTTLKLKDGTKIVCAPADEDVQRLADQLKAASDPKAICIGHFQVVGAIMGGSAAQTGVPLDALKGYATTLLGHVHKPHTVRGGKTGSVHYIGSPFQQDFGEAGELKRVALVDTETAEFEWIEVVGFPTYREVLLKDFLRLKSAHPEDRFRVRVSSVQEAAQVAGAPCGLQAEPVFQPIAQPAQRKAEVWNLEQAVRAWVSDHPFNRYQHPRKTDADVLSDDDLVELGLSLLS